MTDLRPIPIGRGFGAIIADPPRLFELHSEARNALAALRRRHGIEP